MAVYKPLVIVSGKLQQIQSGNTLIGSDGTVKGLFPSTEPAYGFAALTTTGVVVKTDAAGGVTTRTFAGTANQLTISNASGVSGAPTFAIADDVILPGTGSMTVVKGTSAEQPISVAAGQFRYDTDTNKLRWSNGISWQDVSATTGTVTSVGLDTTTTGLTISNTPVTGSGTLRVNLNAELQAVSQLSTTGLVARTGSATYVPVTITGTASRVSITNGNAVGGAPTIDIDAAYVGQTSITTLGTIGTGTWNASTIDIAHGGTGQTTAAAAFNALSPVTSVGDLIIGTGVNTNNRLAIGTNGQILTSNGTTASWAAPATNGTVTSITVTTGTGLLVNGGATETITTAGTFPLTLTTNLQKLSGLTSTGFISRDNVTGNMIERAITGTATRISVTDGDGVLGAPTIDLITVSNAGGGSFVKLSTDGYGRVTGTSAVVAGDITALVDATYVNVSGDTMTGNLTMSSAEVLGLPTTPSGPTAAASKAYVDGLVSSSTVWRDPIVTPSLVDVVSAEPVTPVLYTAYIATTATTWTGSLAVGVNDIVECINATGPVWKIVDTLTAGQRFILTGEHGAMVPGSNALYTAGFRSQGLIQYVSGTPSLFASWTNPQESNYQVLNFTTSKLSTDVVTTAGAYKLSVSKNGTPHTDVVVTVAGTGTVADVVSAITAAFTGFGITAAYDADGGHIHITGGVSTDRVIVTDGTTTPLLAVLTNFDEIHDGQTTGTTVLVSDIDSSDYGHTYIYTSGPNRWIEISGPGAIGAGSGLSYSGNTLNVNMGAGIVALPSDEVGIDLYDAANGAIILTNDGTTRTTLTGDKLYLKLDAAGGLAQTSSGLKINTASVTNAMLANSTITLDADSGTQSLALGGTLMIKGVANRTTVAVSDVGGVKTYIADIHSAYVGQSSITTLGTIGTGTWNATTISTAKGGTGLDASAAVNGALLIGTGTGLALGTLTAGTGMSVVNASGSITLNNTGVTSVSLSAPSIFTVSIPTVTTTGTLTFDLASQSANTVFAAPNGLSGAPTFRSLVVGDIPSLSGVYTTNVTLSGGTTGLTGGSAGAGSNTITLSGTLVAANGGTGHASYVVGDMLYADTTSTLAALAVGAAGTVLHGGATPSYSAVSLTADVSGTLPVANGGTGHNTVTTNGLLIGAGASAMTVVSPGTAGQVLTMVAGVPTWTTSSSETLSFTNTQGTAITVGNVVYMKSDGTVALAEANVGGTSTAIGMVVDASIANNTAGYIALDGVVSGLSSLTPGVTYYLSDTSAGVLTATAPTAGGSYVAEIGIAISTTAIKVNIQPTILL